MTPIKDLAKLIRKDFRAAEIKASVRCNHGTMTSACHIVVTKISPNLEAELIRDSADRVGVEHNGTGGFINARQAFKRALQEHVEAIVAKHIPLHGKGSNYAFVDVVQVKETPHMPLQVVDMKIGHMSICSIVHPEWGSWGVTNKTTHDGATWWDIIGDHGSRTLMQSELKFWELAR